jgi:hypothetical protein
MPKYTIRDRTTGQELKEIHLSISEIDLWEAAHPDWEIAIGSPLIHSGMGLSKPSPEFRDTLKRMKKAHPGSTINDF